MILDEHIGQTLMIGFYGTDIPRETIDLITRERIGGVILFARNIGNAQEVRSLTQKLQRIAQDGGHRYPLLISTDQENGFVRRLKEGTTIFPGNMALGATGSPQLAYDVAHATGSELRALGINMNLAPDADVNNNAANPVIGVRSFGDDPQRVAEYVVSAMHGYRDARIVPCLKHFPGHGDTRVDSHLALPTISHSLEHLEHVELVPFRAGIQQGAEVVMTAHIHFPQLDTLPATISPAIIHGLLREQLGFRGVIISDCMEMSAIRDTVGTPQGVVKALQAGVDLVLVSHHHELQRASVEAIRTAIHNGELSRENIQQAAERVLELKRRTLSWHDALAGTVPDWVGGTAYHQLSQHTYECSTTLVKNADIPLHPHKDEHILVLYPSNEHFSQVADLYYAEGFPVESILRRHLRTEGITVSLRPNDEERGAIQQRASGADIVVMLTHDASRYEEQAAMMCSLLHNRRAPQRIIGIAVHNPYDLQAFPELPTYLATYEYTPPALEAATRVLFGESEARGRLPVRM